MSPDAIRRVNFVPPSAMPYTSPTKLVLDSGEFEKVMDRCMGRPTGMASRRAAREASAGKLRGIGMATYTERCGGGFPETASIEFKDERVELVMGNQEYGTGPRSPHTSSSSRTSSASMPTASMSSWATPTARRAD